MLQRWESLEMIRNKVYYLEEGLSKIDILVVIEVLFVDEVWQRDYYRRGKEGQYCILDYVNFQGKSMKRRIFEMNFMSFQKN